MTDWLTDTEAKFKARPSRHCSARPFWKAGWLSYKLLISECVIISAEKNSLRPDQPEQNIKAIGKSAGNPKPKLKKRAGQGNEKCNQNTNSRKRMFGDVNKDTCCLTGSTWQLLACGVLTINSARDTNNTTSRVAVHSTKNNPKIHLNVKG